MSPQTSDFIIRSRKQRQDLCTTEALRHGESENKWVLFGPLIPGCIQKPGLGYFNFSLRRKYEDTEVLICRRPVTGILRKNKNSGRGNTKGSAPPQSPRPQRRPRSPKSVPFCPESNLPGRFRT